MVQGWKFPSNNFTQLNGIGDAGIETFKGALFSSLAREISQNSLDAINEKDKPVIVEFKKIYIDKSEIPEYEGLENALQNCLEFWRLRKSKKEIDFFKNSCGKLKREKISVLRISDFNTIGLTGSDKEEEITSWQSLVKSSGVSNKSDTSGGSFGIGKSAPFACSDLRTLFYSTYDINGLLATQGVSRLASFKDENGQTTQGIGYYGKVERNTPVNTALNIDSDFSRNNRTGTDIYILGFIDDDNWQQEIIVSVLEGFLLSIYNNKLVVKVGDIEISKETLHTTIEEYKSKAKYTYNYYQVLTSEESVHIKKDFSDLGEVNLSVLISKNMHRKILMSRSTGMKIFDKANVSSTIQFAAILSLEGEDINKFFREMESPQHDAWEPDRHSNKRLAKTKRTELFRFAKEEILNIGRSNTTDEIDAEGVGEFLPDRPIISKNKENKDVQETIQKKTKEIDIKVVDKLPVLKGVAKAFDILGTEEEMSNGIFTEEDADSEGRKSSGKPNKTSGGIGTPSLTKEDNNGNVNAKKIVEVGTTQTRLIRIDKKTNKYRLIISPEKSAKDGFVKIRLSGEQSNIDANILVAYTEKGTLECRKGKILVGEINANVKISITFILDFIDNCSMEVGLYGH